MNFVLNFVWRNVFESPAHPAPMPVHLLSSFRFWVQRVLLDSMILSLARPQLRRK
jgi:hypothetical protein